MAVTTVERVLLLAATAFMSSLCPFVAAQWTLHFLHAQFHVFLLLSSQGPVLNFSVILVLSQKQQGNLAAVLASFAVRKACLSKVASLVPYYLASQV